MKTELKDGKKEIAITHDKPFPSLNDKVLREFITQLESLDTKAILSGFNVKEKAKKKTFEYGFTSKDGREWKQEIVLDAPEDPAMNFSVAGFWKLSEFDLHRPLRAVVVELVNLYKVTEIKCTWY